MGRPIAEVISVNLYLSKSNPPKYTIEARGKVSTSGWTNSRLEPRMYIGGTPPDGGYGFDFVADPPDGLAQMVIQPATAVFHIEGELPSTIAFFRVFSANNDIAVKVKCELPAFT